MNPNDFYLFLVDQEAKIQPKKQKKQVELTNNVVVT
jgi:hypothetical protein